MKNKGFTLIELLVVVAIIGILAAVGVVAYSGYTAGAKKNATKANHNKIVKFIKNSMMLCETGSDLILNGAGGKTSNQCSKLYQSNLANFRAAMVHIFNMVDQLGVLLMVKKGENFVNQLFLMVEIIPVADQNQQ